MQANSHSLPLKVYIEDTDAYMVVYYGNYVRFFERAAASTLVGMTEAGRLLRHKRLGLGMISADGVKYSSAAVLGDTCHVEVTSHGIDADGRLACAAALVRSEDGETLCAASDLRLGWVDGSSSRGVETTWPASPSRVGAAAPAAPAAPAALAELGEPPAASEAPLIDEGLRLHLDECSVVGTLSMHAALRYFERHRTEYLGGPEALASMAGTGVNVVVARMNGVRLLDAAHRTYVGAELALRCSIQIKARGTQIVFRQWLLGREPGPEETAGAATGDGGRQLTPLARADVICLCIDATTGKIVSAPDVVRERLAAYSPH